MKFFLKKKDEKEKIFNDLKETYSSWRDDVREMNKPFFAIHSDFEHVFLKDLSGSALKLYIYLGFRAKYQTGESWESIENISNFFKKDQRTIANWFKELEESGLIFRGQKGFNHRATTFLKPYGFLFDEILTDDDFSTIKDVDQDIKASKELGYIPEFALFLNYGFKEYTLVILNREEAIYHCSCFYNFKEEHISRVKKWLKPMGIPVDNYDIDNPILKAENKKSVIYHHLMKYLHEN